MSDENKNPQNLPIQPQDLNLTEQKPPSAKPKKNILIILLVILVIGIPISFFFFFDSARLKNPPVSIPTVIPKTASTPFPTQESSEFIITLKLKETKLISNTSISLTYKSADIPGDNCNDCITLNVVEAKMNNQTKTLEYSCGGFSGECTIRQDAFGYQAEILEQTSNNSLKLKIKKQ